MRCLRKLYNKRTLEIEKKIKNKEKKIYKTPSNLIMYFSLLELLGK